MSTGPRTTSLFLAALALLFGLLACAPSSSTEATPQYLTLVSVDNPNFADMDIYVSNQPDFAERRRLGMVNGNGQQTFIIPEQYLYQREVYLAARAIGSGAMQTDHYQAMPGYHIRWSLFPTGQ